MRNGVENVGVGGGERGKKKKKKQGEKKGGSPKNPKREGAITRGRGCGGVRLRQIKVRSPQKCLTAWGKRKNKTC